MLNSFCNLCVFKIKSVEHCFKDSNKYKSNAVFRSECNYCSALSIKSRNFQKEQKYLISRKCHFISGIQYEESHKQFAYRQGNCKYCNNESQIKKRLKPAVALVRSGESIHCKNYMNKIYNGDYHFYNQFILSESFFGKENFLNCFKNYFNIESD